MSPEIIGGIARAVLAALGGGLVSKGLVSAGEWETYVGAIVVLVTGAWSVYQKKKAA